MRKLFTALADPTGVLAHRRGALERVQLLLEDWADTQRKLADTETRMTAVLDELELTELATSIHGLSAVGAAAILAETGDPHRFATARALGKHAGLAPRQRQSGTYTGQTRLTGKVDRGCGPWPGARSGARCRPTPSTPAGIGT